jgi:hypothetical protein
MALLSDEVGVRVDTLVPTLTPIQREVFTLVRLYGLQQTEAVKVLGVSVSTIKSHVRRATQRLARGMRALPKGTIWWLPSARRGPLGVPRMNGARAVHSAFSIVP